MTRKPISNTARFEVFKRDSFACQYCGRKPPTVLLEVDHIQPVASGGTNEQINLVTSCEECNRGKAARALDQVPQALSEQVENLRIRAEQVEAYNNFLLNLRQQEQKTLNELGYYWFNKFKGKKDAWVFGPARIPSMRTFLKRLAMVEILEAMDVAHDRLPVAVWSDRDGNSQTDDERTWKYFCGVCWKVVRRREGDTDQSGEPA